MHKPVQELTDEELASVSGGGGGITPGIDIREMGFIVLMNATNDQSHDLQQIMAQTGGTSSLHKRTRK